MAEGQKLKETMKKGRKKVQNVGKGERGKIGERKKEVKR